MLDELQGLPIILGPSLARELGVGHAVAALVLLVAPQLAAAFLEARLLLRAEHGDARRWIAGGQAFVSCCLLASAAAPSPLWLGVALALSAPAAGMSSSLAEGCLAEMSGCHRERAMARWMLAGALGDLCAPGLAALAALAGLGWRCAIAAVGALLAAHAFAVLRGPRLFSPVEQEAAVRRTRLRDVLGRRSLLLWLFAATICTLLDEAFVLLASSWLHDGVGASKAAAAASIGVWAAGSAIGAFVTERMLRRFSVHAVLVTGAALCIAACLGWLAAPSIALAGSGLFVVGLSAAPLWPIAMARAYGSCPGRPALVGAAANLFVPLEIALVVGAAHLADAAGTRVALAAMAVQPVVLLLLAASSPPSIRARPGTT